MRNVTLLALVMLLAGCGSAEQMQPRAAEKLNTFDAEEPAAAPPPGAAPPPAAAAQQIAYSYTYGYTLPGDRIGATQARHIALCRSLGGARCVVLGSELTGREDDAAANTRLMIDARLAASFGKRLDATVAGAGGEQASHTVAAEDVTRELVDTGARVRAKQALATRLLGLINGARGSVADLVAAEKAYADVQEELDAARTMQATLRRRVAMSDVTITYASRAAAHGPVGRALASAGDSFAFSLGAAITFVVALIPWLLIAVPGFLGLRAAWRRWRARRRG